LLTMVLIGTGGSEGIPVHGCNCPVCTEARLYKFLKRSTSSMLITNYGTTITIDMSLETSSFVEDLYVDAVLVTHWHHDHIAGLYKFRWGGNPIDLFAPKGNADEEIIRYPGSMRVHFVKPLETIHVGDFTITPFKLNHTVETMGYYIKLGHNSIAIIYDTKGLPSETEEFLKKNHVRIAFIDATYGPGTVSEKHNNIDEAVEIGMSIKAEKIVLIHISHNNLPYSKLVKYVNRRWNNVLVSHDGMVINLV